MMCEHVSLLLLFPSPYTGGEEARGRSRLEPPPDVRDAAQNYFICALTDARAGRRPPRAGGGVGEEFAPSGGSLSHRIII